MAGNEPDWMRRGSRPGASCPQTYRSLTKPQTANAANLSTSGKYLIFKEKIWSG